MLEQAARRGKTPETGANGKGLLNQWFVHICKGFNKAQLVTTQIEATVKCIAIADLHELYYRNKF